MSASCDPIGYSLPGCSAHGFSRQEYWSGLPFPPVEFVCSNTNHKLRYACYQVLDIALKVKVLVGVHWQMPGWRVGGGQSWGAGEGEFTFSGDRVSV